MYKITFLALAIIATGCAHTVKINTTPPASIYVDGSPTIRGGFDERTGWGKSYEVSAFAACYAPKRVTLKQSNLHAGQFTTGLSVVPIVGFGTAIALASSGVGTPLAIGAIGLGTFITSQAIVWNSFQLQDTYDITLDKISEECDQAEAPASSPSTVSQPVPLTVEPISQPEPIPESTSEYDEVTERYYRDRRLRQLELDGAIGDAKERRNKGLLIFGGGSAVSLASWLAFAPETHVRTDANGMPEFHETGNRPLFWTGFLAGSAIEVVGLYMFAEGWWTASALESQKYRLGLTPSGDGAAFVVSRDF